MTTPSLSVPFELHAGPFTGRDLVVASFRGREEIGRPFRFDVMGFTRIDGGTLEASLPGQAASLLMQSGEGAPRVVRGIIASFEREGPPNAYGDIGFRARLVPRLWLLERRTRSRIFQNLSVVAIVDAVLSEYTIAPTWRLSKPARPRAYCVQYQETDYAFVRRILSEDGMFFSFAHPPAGEEGTSETLVLSDDAHYPLLDGAGATAGEGLVLRYCDRAGMTPTGAFAFAFARARSVRANAVVLRDFDFANPALFPTERAMAAKARDTAATARVENVIAGVEPEALEVYEHHGDYLQPEVDERRAQMRLDQLRRRTVVGRGESWCRWLAPGYRFTLDEHPSDELNGEYAITRVRSEGRSPERSPDGERTVIYTNTFECVPADVAYRPKRLRRALQQTLETATVVGPEGHEIHTDAQGRIKVQFHWDREGKRDEHSSCWMRTMQSWGGAGFGTQIIPRVGMEVLVMFLGGDVDRPMVVGCTYNAAHPTPFRLPDDATRSGLRTQSSPGGDGYNELSFEDQKGEEQILLRAQKDLDEEILHDHTTTVGNDETLRVAANRRVTVGGDDVARIAGDRGLEVAGGRMDRITGEDILVVTGGRTERIGQSLAVIVAGGARASVGGDAVTAIEEDHALRVGGSSEVVVGTKDGDTGASVAVWGRCRAVVSDALILDSQTKIVLKCGDSSVTITPDDITLTAKKLRLTGTDEAALAGSGASFKLDGDGHLRGKKVEIHSSGASVVLDSDAKVDGDTVKLNCGADDPDDESSAPADDKDETQPLVLTLCDEQKKPYAGKRYLLAALDKSWKGTTGGDGKIQHDVPKSAKVAHLTLWVSDQQPKEMVIDIGELPPSDTLRGALLRLRNLGYYAGAIVDDPDEPVREALMYFQVDQGLEPTGALDGATKAKIDAMAHQ